MALLHGGRRGRQGRLVCGGYNEGEAKQSACFSVDPKTLAYRPLLDLPIASTGGSPPDPSSLSRWFGLYRIRLPHELSK